MSLQLEFTNINNLIIYKSLFLINGKFGDITYGPIFSLSFDDQRMKHAGHIRSKNKGVCNASFSLSGPC